MRHFLVRLLIVIGTVAALNSYFKGGISCTRLTKTYVSPLKKVEANYAASVDALCAQRGLPADYFKALIILECGGENPAGSRFERHVYRKLRRLRDGRIPEYSGVKTAQVRGLPDWKLREMATSWGPLQIMGYHSLAMGVSIDDLKGPDALRHGIDWSEKAYGPYLRKADYRNAFHLHNTGRLHPRLYSATHNPQYVSQGLAYAQQFRK